MKKKKKDLKGKWVAFLFAFFLGAFGVHKFYLGNNKAGVIYLILFFIFFYIPAFLALIDAIKILCTSEEEFNKQYNS